MKIANAFEFIVALAQMFSVFLSLWLIAEDGTVMGIAMEAETVANARNVLVLVTVAGMFLRFLAIMPVAVPRNT